MPNLFQHPVSHRLVSGRLDPETIQGDHRRSQTGCARADAEYRRRGCAFRTIFWSILKAIFFGRGVFSFAEEQLSEIK
ncbi:MAG TPA: hypothetical protein VEW26_01170 [Allosphingosinicella sp.]|nr:hypothetical protein [Allosphingosinicella sp.]